MSNDDFFGNLPPLVDPGDFPPEASRRVRWERFDDLNPHIYGTLLRMTRLLKKRGRDRIGIRMLWERLRWSYAVSTVSDDFKLNDHYTRFYAREIMGANLDLVNIFEIREREDSPPHQQRRHPSPPPPSNLSPAVLRMMERKRRMNP